mmetsp:Transcript_60328/g.134567  ORF Transcript_60328/g.134567 Transcript_60328/m.134567 type:complete len:83 (-) Transcript_60328:3082-3330(-)
METIMLAITAKAAASVRTCMEQGFGAAWSPSSLVRRQKGQVPAMYSEHRLHANVLALSGDAKLFTRLADYICRDFPLLCKSL